jgi:WD40 repeat protein
VLAVAADDSHFFSNTAGGLLAWRIAENFAESLPLWSADTGLEMYTELSRDGALVAVSGDNRALFDTVRGSRIFEPLPDGNVEVGCYSAFFALSPSGRYVAGSGFKQQLDVFELPSQTPVAALPTLTCNTAAAFSPDEALLATSDSEVYRTSDWTPLWQRGSSFPSGESSPMDSVQFTPDGTGIVVSRCRSGSDRTPRFTCEHRLYEALGGSDDGSLPLEAPRPSFSSDGSWVVAGNEVYRRGSAERRALADDVTAAAFTAHDDIIAGADDGRLMRYCRLP